MFSVLRADEQSAKKTYKNMFEILYLRVLKDLIKIEMIFYNKDENDTRIKHVFLNAKGKKIFNEIFEVQKKRIYNALLNSSSQEVINFDEVLKRIING